MNRKTVYMLVGLLVVMLAALGVGYALWFEDLKIHGEVTTGELDVQFSLYDPIEWFSNEGNIPIENVPESKFDTVNCSSAFVEYNGLLDSPESSGQPPDDGPEVIQFSVEGMYPSYHCLLQFDITNTGTVPVHFYGELPTETDVAIHQMIVDDLTCVRRDGTDMGCVRSQGYWGSHSTCGNAPRDDGWDKLPQAENTPFFGSGQTWCNMFQIPPGQARNYGLTREYVQLAYQYMAAHLNKLNGASMPADVEAAYYAASNFFDGGSPYPLDAKDLLDSYNNGEEGVPYCDTIANDGPGGEVLPLPITDFQLHTGESIDCFLELHFTNADDAVAEDTSYSFQYHIRAYQWNEDDEGRSLAFPEWYNDIFTASN